MMLVALLIAVALVGLLFYRKPLRVDRSDLAPPSPPRPPRAASKVPDDPAKPE